MGEILVRASVWLALLCYPAGPAGRRFETGLCRALWTIGAVAFLVHVVSSFAVHYQWSHAVALRETARQTAELIGRPVASGLYVNYLFAALWVGDAVWWWIDSYSHRRRPAGLDIAIHTFFLFIVFNGAVVFVQGPVRWLGLAVTLAGIAALVASHRDRGHR